MFGRKPPQKGSPLIPEPRSDAAPKQDNGERRLTFSKVFRWHLPDGQIQQPDSVEVVGSFTHWQRVPLVRDSAVAGWHVTLHHLQGNRTHHYMLLVDGKPTFDKTCDGLAVPHGPEEERYQLTTEKGPRVMMLFAQTK
ncbi:MAG TPA: glycogen-binding domain-containing protein [Verrucomicrobiae bacterium]|nr:glycogen-binding domain-containing protein [Verrucomicrobiae bacterium]